MDIPKYIEVKTATGQRAAFLSPQADGLKDCYVDTRLNGESTLEFLLPANSEKINELVPECQIWAGGRVYTLLKDDAIETVRDENNKLWAKFSAIERWAELDSQFVEPSISNDPTAKPPADLAVIIVGGGNDLSGGRYTVGSAGHALYAVLNGSGWSVGTVDVEGIRDLEMEKESRLALVKAIQKTWGGYLVWDSVNRIVHLRDAGKWQNYNGFQIRYKKNLKHISRTEDNKLITKMYCFGHDDLDIAAVNSGKKYLTNNSYTTREYAGIYRNQDIYDAQELKEKSTAELALICRPRYLYRVKMVDVRTLPEYSHENFSLGDMADVIDPDIAPDSPRSRIIRHKYNLFQPWKCELEIGDPEERLVEQLKASFDTTSFVGGKFNGNGQISGYSIEGLTIDDGKIISIEANKITTKEAKITTAQIETLTVGGNVFMGPNATISWSQVTNQPYIPVLPSYIQSTKITKTSIESPTIIGGVIIGGSITSNSIINVETTIKVNTPGLGGIEFTGGGSILRDPSGDINIFANRYIYFGAGAGYAFGSGDMLVNVNRLGFFGVGPVSRQPVALLGSKTTTETAGATYSQNEANMLNNLKYDMQSVFVKIDGLIRRLGSQGYGLFNEN